MSVSKISRLLFHNTQDYYNHNVCNILKNIKAEINGTPDSHVDGVLPHCV